jgi:imidazole glycerol-phosphate synthase subunit HisH
MIAIIDYKLGNLTSVKNALDKLNIPNFISDDPEKLKTSKGLILPGVGAAGTGMKNLKAKNLDQLIIQEIKNGKPFLGTCLGMQLLFEFSDEDKTECLGIFKGTVKKFPSSLKVPQIGWNTTGILNSESKVMENIKDESYFYFVNSYYCEPLDKSIITGVTEYGIIFASIVEKDNVFATQFHSEKSGDDGLQLLKNFGEICK